MRQSERKHFIVKHDLESLELLPNFIWKIDKPLPKRRPIKLGDRWIAFAYINNERQKQALCQINGFYECTQEALYRDIPLSSEKLNYYVDGKQQAWMIEGKEYGAQPPQAVNVPPINKLLHRKTFNGEAITPITPEEFEQIRLNLIAEQQTAQITESPTVNLSEAMEGKIYLKEAAFRTRNRLLIESKKATSDYKCEVCGFKFIDTYGEIGEYYIVAHHLETIGSRNKSTKTGLDDIALVCANCHAMLHKRNPPIPLRELKEMWRR